MVRIMELTDLKMRQNKGYKFVDEKEFSSWDKDKIYSAKGNGIIDGIGNDKFDAQGKATVEQALLITNKILERYKGNIKEKAITKNDVLVDTNQNVLETEGGYYTYSPLSKLANHYIVFFTTKNRTIKREGIIKSDTQLMPKGKRYESIKLEGDGIVVPFEYNSIIHNSRHHVFEARKGDYNEVSTKELIGLDGKALMPKGYIEYGRNLNEMFFVKDRVVYTFDFKKHTFLKKPDNQFIPAWDKLFHNDQEFAELMSKYGSEEIVNINSYGFSYKPPHLSSKSAPYLDIDVNTYGIGFEFTAYNDRVKSMILDFMDYAYQDETGYKQAVYRMFLDIESTNTGTSDKPYYSTNLLDDRVIKSENISITYADASKSVEVFLYADQ